MPQYRYRPADNRTPVNDPVLGHLSWDGVYDDPRCADDPRFEEIEPRKRAARKKTATSKTATTGSAKAPASPAAQQTPANRTASAGKSGRSK